MRLLSILLSAGAAAAASARHFKRDDEIFACGTQPDADQLAIAKLIDGEASSGNFTEQATITVRVYIHVVAASSSVADGNASDQMLNNQLVVLNQNYAPYGISFTSGGTDRTINSNWANGNDADGMKAALRKGTYADLNLYVQKEIGMVGAGTIFGQCVLPFTVRPGDNPSVYATDGCQVITRSLPGGSAAPFNTGKTATHEIGHWFGLLHTFEGGCDGSGDLVNDTPAEAGPASGCNTSSDSCPNQPGLDPVHNHMDYSDESCRTEFTPGQQARMVSVWNSMRAGK